MPKFGGVYEVGREKQQNGVKDSEGAEKGRALVPPHPSAVIPRKTRRNPKSWRPIHDAPGHLKSHL